MLQFCELLHIHDDASTLVNHSSALFLYFYVDAKFTLFAIFIQLLLYPPQCEEMLSILRIFLNIFSHSCLEPPDHLYICILSKLHVAPPLVSSNFSLKMLFERLYKQKLLYRGKFIFIYMQCLFVIKIFFTKVICNESVHINLNSKN